MALKARVRLDQAGPHKPRQADPQKTQVALMARVRLDPSTGPHMPRAGSQNKRRRMATARRAARSSRQAGRVVMAVDPRTPQTNKQVGAKMWGEHMA